MIASEVIGFADPIVRTGADPLQDVDQPRDRIGALHPAGQLLDPQMLDMVLVVSVAAAASALHALRLLLRLVAADRPIVPKIEPGVAKRQLDLPERRLRNDLDDIAAAFSAGANLARDSNVVRSEWRARKASPCSKQ